MSFVICHLSFVICHLSALPTTEERLNRLAEINVMAQVKNLYQTSIMRKALHEQKAPFVHGWVLDISSGLIKDLQVSTTQWQLSPLCAIALTNVKVHIPILQSLHTLSILAILTILQRGYFQ